MSEVARLKQQIELECQSMKQAMDGFRFSATHEIINHRYITIGNIQERLATLVGEQEAATIAVEAYIQIMG